MNSFLSSAWQHILSSWKSGRNGKIAIGCSTLLLACVCCMGVSFVYSLTPAYRASANATATTSPIKNVIPTEEVQPTPTRRATATTSVSRTPTEEPAKLNTVSLETATKALTKTATKAPSTVTPTKAPVVSSQCPQGCTTHVSGCDIKGNINNKGEKIYHVPGSPSYNNTKIDPEKGERWFCTEAEAQSNGFRPSKQ